MKRIALLLVLLLPLTLSAQLTSFGGLAVIPDVPVTLSGAPSFTNVTVDADGEGYGMVFQAPATCSITDAGVPTGTVTTGDASVLLQLESINSSATPAIPSGTIIAAGRSVVIGVTTSNSWQTGTFGTPYSATQGEVIAVTITRQAAGSLNTTFRGFGDENNGTGVGMAYSVNNASAGWVVPSSAAPGFAIKCGGSWLMIRGAYPYTTITSLTVGTGTTPDTVGNVWIPRVKSRVYGCWAWIDLDGPVVINFYDTDGSTVLAKCTVATNMRPANTSLVGFYPFDDAAGAVTVSPTVGGTYRIAIQPSSATTMTAYDIQIADGATAAYQNALPFGVDFYKTVQTDLGAWTPTTTSRIMVGLLIDQFDAGASSGGGGGIIGQ